MLRSRFRNTSKYAIPEKDDREYLAFKHATKSIREFRIILERERARADRNGHGFSLVTFCISGNQNGSERFEPLTMLLSRRLRMTDEFGWFDGRSIGVILYCTPADSAGLFVADVREECLGEMLPLDCKVYTYPLSWQPPDNGSENSDDETGGDNGSGRKQPDGISGRDRDRDHTAYHCPHSAGDLRSILTAPMPLWKSLMDIIGSSAAIILLAPILFAAALAVKVTSRGPIIFKQQRAGLRGKRFTCYKFRTMVADAEARKAGLLQQNERSRVVFKMKKDPRVTLVGRILRKTSVDELPQLFNVLKGEMSLVGPRPLPYDESMQQDPWHRVRLDIIPGITGLWQVRAREDKSFDRWVRLDIEYARRRSPLFDLKLLILTIPAILSMKGAH